MTAHALATAPRIRNARSARVAAQRRVVAKQRGRYAPMRAIVLSIAAVMTVLLSEVLLTANITGLSYAVDRAHAQRGTLEADAARLDDQVAALVSDERLVSVAGSLRMTQPQRFERIPLQVPGLPQLQPAIAETR